MYPHSVLKKYGYLWVTAVLFITTFIGHWVFAWYAYVDEQLAHNEPVDGEVYVTEVMRDTLENWQSEFLQLIWQVAGLSILLYVGSPQSKESDERKEEKIDYIISLLDPKQGRSAVEYLDRKYPRA